jgi:SSS family solute:Na+ symporter
MASTTSFKAAIYTITVGGMSFPGYIALYSLVANIVVAVVLSLLLRPFVKPAVAFGGN